MRIEPTPSQEKSIQYIRDYFTHNWNGHRELHRFEWKMLDYGVISLVVETTNNVYTNMGGHFFVYSHGRIACANVYNLDKDKKFWQKAYTEMKKSYISYPEREAQIDKVFPKEEQS